MKDNTSGNESFMMRLATFIVDKRNLFFLITIIGIIFSIFSRNWIQVENELAAFLPDHSATRKGLDIMEDQFVTFGSAQVMISNITLKEAWDINERIKTMEGVQSVTFDETTDHYASASALYSITFDYSEKDQACLDALAMIEETFSDYDLYVSTSLGNSTKDIIAAEVRVIMVYVAVIVVAVLLLTSQTYAEVPVLLITFVAAMILNLGTNFLLGKISFVSNSVTSILQLALSLDYAVIFCNRFKEEHETLPIREAAIVALSKAIPEIGASSLTTIGGLVAMLFMQFKIGPDMAICLIKAILFALLSVFILMPGLLILFGPLMDKTKHRSFVPKIPFVGKFAYATRFIVPPVFVAVILLAMHFSGDCPYVYGYGSIETPKLNHVQIAEQMIDDTFTSSDMVALVFPSGDYGKERAMLEELEEYDEVAYTMGLSNIEAMDGYMLADKLTPRQFAELADLDYELARVVYTAYAAKNEDYGQIVGNISTYSVSLMDMFLFVCDHLDAGYVTLDDEQSDALHEAQKQIENARVQLQGEAYNRVLVYLDLPEGGNERYTFLDTIQETAEKYYPGGDVYVVGNLTTEYDFQKSFSRDNTVVSIVSILIVLVVLLFTFKSAGMPVLLILVIQGAIWINFSVPAFTGTPLFFMSYLVVSSIQMGANIDYAIVSASRYMELKSELPHREAIIETMNFAFPTIITSGTILAVAGTLIGQMTSEAAIVGIGQSLGRGTIISIILIMFVLPQILLLGGSFVDKTSFSVPAVARKKAASGRVKVDGLVRGEVSGTVSGTMHAIVEGDVNLNLISGSVLEEADDEK
ncbi:MAG: MMPL family transporter [Clostridiales bacterium]|nr:MMPL family transporter [Clostridiales bacterium]